MNNIIDFYCKKYDSGIVMCIATTNERWVQFNDISYDKNLNNLTFLKLSDVKGDIESFYESPNIQTFDLDLDVNMEYIKLEQINKDQISIYFIPYDLLDKEKWLKKQQLKVQK